MEICCVGLVTTDVIQLITLNDSFRTLCRAVHFTAEDVKSSASSLTPPRDLSLDQRG